MERNEGFVRGTLAFLLRFERFWGLAPLNFIELKNGYIATVSQKFSVYSCLYTFIIHFLIIVSFMPILWKDVLSAEHISIIVLNVLLGGLGSYKASSRMNKMLNYLYDLEKIHFDANKDYDRNANEKKLSIFIITTLVLFGILDMINFYTYFIVTFEDSYIRYLFIILSVIHIEYFRGLLLAQEDMLFKYEILQAVKIISKELRSIKDLKNLGIILRNIRDMKLKRVHKITKSYNKIYGLITRLNSSHDFYLFFLLSTSIVHFILLISNFIDFLHRNDQSTYQSMKDYLQLIWIFFYIVKVVLFVEPCQQIIEEENIIRLDLSKLMHHLTPVGTPMSLGLDVMYKELTLYTLTVKPSQMYQVQRQLMITAVGFVTTYLVMVLQYFKNI